MGYCDDAGVRRFKTSQFGWTFSQESTRKKTNSKSYFGCKWNYGAPIQWFYKKKKKVTWVISPLSLVELWANGRGPSCGDVENTASGCKWMITVRRPCFTVLENSYSIV